MEVPDFYTGLSQDLNGPSKSESMIQQSNGTEPKLLSEPDVSMVHRATVDTAGRCESTPEQPLRSSGNSPYCTTPASMIGARDILAGITPSSLYVPYGVQPQPFEQTLANIWAQSNSYGYQPPMVSDMLMPQCSTNYGLNLSSAHNHGQYSISPPVGARFAQQMHGYPAPTMYSRHVPTNGFASLFPSNSMNTIYSVNQNIPSVIPQIVNPSRDPSIHHGHTHSTAVSIETAPIQPRPVDDSCAQKKNASETANSGMTNTVSQVVGPLLADTFNPCNAQATHTDMPVLSVTPTNELKAARCMNSGSSSTISQTIQHVLHKNNNHVSGQNAQKYNDDEQISDSVCAEMQRFNRFTDEQAREFVLNSESKNTRSNTSWAISVFRAFLDQCRTTDGVAIPEPENMPRHNIIKYVIKLILGAKKQNGREYTLQSIANLVAGIQRFFRENGHPEINFMTKGPFNEVRKVVNAKMKSLAEMGHGSVVQQSDPLTDVDIQLLWDKKIFGDHNSLAMVRTVFFYVTYYFMVRGGKEHLELKLNQFTFHSDEKFNMVTFNPYANKNHKFSVEQLKNTQIPRTQHSPVGAVRCPVSVMKKYIGIIRELKASAMRRKDTVSPRIYFRPTYPIREGVLDYNIMQPIGINKLRIFTREICADAGIEGFDDKMIKLRSGHHSNALDNYKRPTSDSMTSLSLQLNPKSQLNDSLKNCNGNAYDAKNVVETPEYTEPPVKIKKTSDSMVNMDLNAGTSGETAMGNWNGAHLNNCVINFYCS